MTIPRSFGTHSGTFHADEVTACALLLLFNFIDKDKIFRTRDPAHLASCEYICDVGGEYNPSQHKFDHHQASYKGELSSAGMIWLHFKNKKIISEDLYFTINRAIIQGVDAHDNGRGDSEIGVCTFSNIISNFVPISYDSSAKDQDLAFLNAVDFTFSHLERLLKRCSYVESCKQKVVEVMSSNQVCLMFDEPLPWMDAFFNHDGEKHPALFVIMPSGNHWKLRGIPPLSNDRMKVRVPLPLEWAGLLDADLRRVSEIPGAIFCHKGRFISVWETKEGAIAALEEVLKKEKK
ncbi:MAG: MYG1 family protein [Chlamydiae bacterium]|nr:MYG1 family protein [Chlamydiota bacterium]